MKTSPRLIIPLLLAFPTFAQAVDISAQSAVVIDAGSGRILFEKNAKAQRFPASTTKIMTALLLIERTRPEELITAPKDIQKIGQSSMNLKPFEKVPAKDLLYAIMLRSANDGSYAAATHISGSLPAFAKLMNKRAAELGCKNTNFVNANGLNDPNHKTTAYDLALISREAMKYPEFRDVVKTHKIEIARTKNQADRVMVNKNKLLKKDPTNEGIKTGWTIPAGYCFVGAATRDGFRAISVVLKSGDWQGDTQKILKEAYDQYALRDQVQQREPVGTVTVERALAELPVGPQEAAYALARKSDPKGIVRSIEPRPGLTAPILDGERVGDLVFRDGEGFEQRVPLVALQDVEAAGIVRRAGQNPVFFMMGSVLFGSVFWMRSHAKRRWRSYAQQTYKARTY